jgi:hypothetical protein
MLGRWRVKLVAVPVLYSLSPQEKEKPRRRVSANGQCYRDLCASMTKPHLALGERRGVNTMNIKAAYQEKSSLEDAQYVEGSNIASFLGTCLLHFNLISITWLFARPTGTVGKNVKSLASRPPATDIKLPSALQKKTLLGPAQGPRSAFPP